MYCGIGVDIRKGKCIKNRKKTMQMFASLRKDE
jgi:hypothetical protein